MEKNQVYIILGILLGLNLIAWAVVWELAQGAKLLEVTFFACPSEART